VYNNEGVDYTHNDAMCSGVWNGLEIIAEKCTHGSEKERYEVIACANQSTHKNNYGWGEVESKYKDHMAGRQDNYTYCG